MSEPILTPEEIAQIRKAAEAFTAMQFFGSRREGLEFLENIAKAWTQYAEDEIKRGIRHE